MQLNSKFGLGEIVLYERTGDTGRRGQLNAGALFEVISISYSASGFAYACRHPEGHLIHFQEAELEGDPAYSQELGAYPKEENKHEPEAN